ncbi:MAG: G8 domain-containing protein [Armatimonadota bacterium]
MMSATLSRAICVFLAFATAVWPVVFGGAPSLAATPRITSVRDGRWSSPGTWEPKGVPGSGMAVAIAKGTTVEYDVSSDRELAAVEVEGRLIFSEDRSTRLDAGNVIVRAGGALEMGSQSRPIPPSVVAEVRLVVREGVSFAGGDFNPGDVGVWVLPGGRWDVHGAAIRHTWTKLARSARSGDSTIVVREDLSDWPRGADIVVTPTGMNPTGDDFEERKVAGVRRLADGLYAVTLTSPLGRSHDGGEDLAGEVALLTRNVRITSKYPSRVKAHTVYMGGAKGGIAYAEFKELGAFGVLSRYPIHFHMMGDSSRGMVVRGASIWRSDNHFMNIHGSNGLRIEDTVGYDAPGMGFFIETVESRQQQASGETHAGAKDAHAPAARPGEQRTTGEQRAAGRQQRKTRAARDRPKGEETGSNLETVFVHNLGAKGFWRPGSLDEPRRMALFWIASFNGILIDNVAVGSKGGRDSAGFHFAEQSENSLTAAPLVMVRNEAHSNDGHGLFSWTNTKLAFDVVGFKAWRNARSGIALGAYNNRIRIVGADLSENGEYGINAWVVRAWIQDSTIRRGKIGLLFNRHNVQSDPQNPALIVNTKFLEHSVADVSQDHRPCTAPEEERVPDSRRCPANYAVFARPQLLSRQPIDFGWHQNANSWLEVVDWQSPVAGLPSSFRIVRKDGDTPAARLVPLVDGRVQPVQRAWDYPPTVDLVAQPSGPSASGMTLRARPHDDRGITGVEFFADGVLVQRVTAPPYDLPWRGVAQDRRPAYVYARAIDTAGNVAYSQVLRLAAPSP